MRKTAALAAFGTLLTAGPFLGAATAQADDPAAPAPAAPVNVSVQTAAGTKSVSATGTVADALAAAGVVADANDLKPRSVRDLRYTRPPYGAGGPATGVDAACRRRTARNVHSLLTTKLIGITSTIWIS